MATEKTSKSQRTRNWVCVVYPESAPDDWREILDSQHIQWVESPLHDLDVEATGEVKKAHWHVLLMFSGMKSYEQVWEILAPLNCTIPQKCHCAKGAVRYMAHLDNPEKHQYSPSTIVGHNGADIAELLKPTSADRYRLISDMISFIKDGRITEFQDLMDYASQEHFDDWFPLLCDNSAYVVGQYIKSQRHRLDPSSDVVKTV